MAKLTSNSPTVEPFIINCETTTNLDKEWTLYLEEFELFLLASGISNNRQRVALLLRLGGKDLREIYKTLIEQVHTFDAVKQKPSVYFKPKKSVTYERYKFKDAKQERRESSVNYITRLKSLTTTCDFQDDTINDM